MPELPSSGTRLSGMSVGAHHHFHQRGEVRAAAQVVPAVGADALAGDPRCSPSPSRKRTASAMSSTVPRRGERHLVEVVGHDVGAAGEPDRDVGGHQAGAHRVGADADRAQLVGRLLHQHLQASLADAVRRHVPVGARRGDGRDGHDARRRRRAARCTAECLIVRNAPVRLVPITLFQSSSVREVQRGGRAGAGVGDHHREPADLRAASSHAACTCVLVGDVAHDRVHARPPPLRSPARPLRQLLGVAAGEHDGGTIASQLPWRRPTRCRCRHP